MDLGALMGMLGGGASGQSGGLDPTRIGQLAQQFGLPPELATQALQHMASAAQTGQAQTPDQAVEHASRETGLDVGSLAQMLQQLVGGQAGGAQAGGFMGMATQMLDRDKDGSVIDDLTRLGGGIFKR